MAAKQWHSYKYFFQTKQFGGINVNGRILFLFHPNNLNLNSVLYLTAEQNAKCSTYFWRHSRFF